MNKHNIGDSSINASAREFKMKGIVSGLLSVVGVIAIALYGHVPAAVADITDINNPPPSPLDQFYNDGIYEIKIPRTPIPRRPGGPDRPKEPIQCKDGRILPDYCKHLTTVLPECKC